MASVCALDLGVHDADNITAAELGAVGDGVVVDPSLESCSNSLSIPSGFVSAPLINNIMTSIC